MSSATDRIELTVGDITKLEVDAVVNAANQKMLGGGGVDGAIHRAAGPGLKKECEQVPEVGPGVRCPTGEARITSGHNLPAKHVIHTVGPVYSGGGKSEADQLASCYRESLRLAEENGLESVAFPAISTGVYGYPREEAARIAVQPRTVWTAVRAASSRG
jgi:O-acetyl-ADP-ribose deacetylase (regulator of RNase III)